MCGYVLQEEHSSVKLNGQWPIISSTSMPLHNALRVRGRGSEHYISVETPSTAMLPGPLKAFFMMNLSQHMLNWPDTEWYIRHLVRPKTLNWDKHHSNLLSYVDAPSKLQTVQVSHHPQQLKNGVFFPRHHCLNLYRHPNSSDSPADLAGGQKAQAHG